MTEFQQAIALADRVLDKPYIDPDGDICMLARQFNRLNERVDHLRVSLGHAIKIIEEHVPRDALGMNAQGDPDVPGGFQQWPLLDEYLHEMRTSLASVSAPVSGVE